MRFLLVAAAAMVAAPAVLTTTPTGAVSYPSSWVVTDVNGAIATLAAQAVTSVGGTLVESLGVDDAVEATLTPAEVWALQAIPGIELTPNISIALQGSFTAANRSPAAVFPSQTGATQLWAQKDTGAGVTVAVLDTGIDPLPDFGSRLIGGVDLTGEGNPYQDDYGHGTFVAGLIASSGVSSGGAYMGEAPGADLVAVKVAGASGSTNLATVIAGVGWTIANAKRLNIRVLNMSLGFVPWEPSALNPLDQAVDQAWAAGIVVVTSAGNAGPFNGTILSPGDDPLALTVGALDDMGSTSSSGDTMASFSSVGPTDPDGFMKPDLVASGRSVVSLAAPGSTVYDQNPSARIGSANFVGSGTSFSAAITSGAVALDLARNAKDNPNDVKARLLATASPGPSGNPFVDGHGELDVAAAVTDNGVHLAQSYGYVDVGGSMQGAQVIHRGDVLTAGYDLAMPGSHPLAVTQVFDAAVTLPVSCTQSGTPIANITINLSEGPYTIGAGNNADVPANSSASPLSFQGSTVAPDLCAGAPMYNATASLTGEVLSSDATDPLLLQFHYLDVLSLKSAGWSPTVTVTPISPVPLGAAVGLSVPWALSTWDTKNWSGLSAPSTSTTPSGVAGSAWNSSAWNGSAWNGSAWNGSAWNGSAWNGSAWNGSAWNGSAWNGSAWNGSAWNGSAWNGAEWG